MFPNILDKIKNWLNEEEDAEDNVSDIKALNSKVNKLVFMQRLKLYMTIGVMIGVVIFIIQRSVL